MLGKPLTEPERPNQARQIDAKKFYKDQGRWVWQTSVLDVYDRRIVGYVVRKTCRAGDTKDALAISLGPSVWRFKPDFI